MAVFVADEQSDVQLDADRLTRLTSYVLQRLRVPPAMEVSVLCVDVDTMSALNERHMGGEGPTDVLAFPLDAPGESGLGAAILGDVVVCPGVARGQAEEHDRSTEAELDVLVVHGLLHLLGHDHAEAGPRETMFDLTDELLAGFGSTGSMGPDRLETREPT